MVASGSVLNRRNRIRATMDFDQMKRILAAFEHHKVDYVLVGGMAMAARGLIRATRDIDVVISAMADDVEQSRDCTPGTI